MTDEFFDPYERFDLPEQTPWRKPRKTPRHVPLEDLTSDSAPENRLQTTYKPSRFEAGWLFSSLGSFYEQNLITDVLSHVKGGKEASVYCCKPGLNVDQELLAVKVYRPRQFRNLRNDA